MSGWWVGSKGSRYENKNSIHGNSFVHVVVLVH